MNLRAMLCLDLCIVVPSVEMARCNEPSIFMKCCRVLAPWQFANMVCYKTAVIPITKWMNSSFGQKTGVDLS